MPLLIFSQPIAKTENIETVLDQKTKKPLTANLLATPSWVGFASILLSWTLVCLIFYPSSSTLWYQWAFHDTGYTHGALILAMVIYLLYELREPIKEKMRAERLNPSARPLRIALGTLLAGGSTTWAIAYIMDIQVVQWLMLPILITLTSALLYGYRIGVTTLSILAFIYLGIPVWEILIPPLQSISVWANSHLLALFNIPAHINGIFVTVPHGHFEIADGCSGLRYFLVSLTLGGLYGYLYYESIPRRIVLILFSVLVGTAFNWIRIFIIILVGYKTQMQSSLVNDHETFGWILFAFALIPIFTFAHYLSPPLPPTQPSPNDGENTSHKKTTADSVTLERLRVQAVSIVSPSSAKHFIREPGQPNSALIAVTLALLIIGPLSAYLLKSNVSTPAQYPLYGPFELGEWQQVPKQRPLTNRKSPLTVDWKPDYYNSDQSIDAFYKHPNWEEPVRLSMRVYFHQKQGTELIYFQNRSYDPDIWKKIDKQTVTLNGQTLQQYQIIKPTRRVNASTQRSTLLLNDYFYVGGAVTSNTLKAKLLQLKSLLFGRQDAIYFGFAADCKSGKGEKESCDAAQERLNRFIEDFQTYYKLH